jgi:hypothetical protein
LRLQRRGIVVAAEGGKRPHFTCTSQPTYPFSPPPRAFLSGIHHMSACTYLNIPAVAPVAPLGAALRMVIAIDDGPAVLLEPNSRARLHAYAAAGVSERVIMQAGDVRSTHTLHCLSAISRTTTNIHFQLTQDALGKAEIPARCV